jgi:probable F420-dependent oxidoreductase
MRFMTALPGVSLYPPIEDDWRTSLRPEDFQLMARTADELGFDSIATAEHIVVPNPMAQFMGSFWPHAMTVMAFAAGATSRIIVDSSIIVLPYHNPVVLAKAVSTLDLLSGGRVRISVGVGHAEAEFQTLGVPFHERGRLADEYLAAMIELWTNPEPEFHGRYVEIKDVAFAPRPVQTPHPPIWIGGNSEAAMRRAARHDGWFPWMVTVEQLPERLDFIRSLPDFENRTRPFDVQMPISDSGGQLASSGAQAVIDAIAKLREIGVTWTSSPTPLASSLRSHLEGLHWFAEEVMPAFR